MCVLVGVKKKEEEARNKREIKPGEGEEARNKREKNRKEKKKKKRGRRK
jgi:hypothetical protein